MTATRINGKELWERIENEARNKHNADGSFKMTFVEIVEVGLASYVIKNGITDYSGYIEYNPY